MQLFLDTIDKELIRHYVDAGIISGVTTNPSLLVRAGLNYGAYRNKIAEICAILKDNVSVQVQDDSVESALKQAEELLSISCDIVIKVPLTEVGLKVCRIFYERSPRVRTNVTLCFSPAQALMAARAGATFVSPFMGRLEEYNGGGIQLIQDIVKIYRNYPEIETKVLAASIRSVDHIIEAAKAGADIATVSPAIIKQMYHHPLTEKGLAIFQADWQKI